MEYIYAALLLNRLGKEISEENVTKVLTAAGASVNEARVKALVAALKGVNVGEVISQAAAAPVSAAAPAAAPKKEEKEEKKLSEAEAASGLSSLFG